MTRIEHDDLVVKNVLSGLLSPSGSPALPERPKVVGYRYELDVDSLNDDSVNIWVLLDDAEPEGNLHWTAVEPIESAIHDAFKAAGVERWPHVSFRLASEQAELDSGALDDDMYS